MQHDEIHDLLDQKNGISKKVKSLIKEYDMDPVSAHMIAIELHRNAMMRQVLYDVNYDEPITHAIEDGLRKLTWLKEVSQAIERLDLIPGAISELAEAIRNEMSSSIRDRNDDL